MFGKLNFGEVHAAPPDDGGIISMIRGAGLPRRWPSFPPAVLEAGEEWLLGSFPWRIARASASRPSRVRRVASSMSMFGFMFMSSILLWGNVGQSGTCPFLSGRVGQALKTGATRWSANAVLQRLFHGQAGMQGAKDMKGGDRLAGEFGRDIVGDAGETQNLNV
jgi:hypothetical protein